MRYYIGHLAALEAESIFILREAVAECRRPVLLFSGGKDSAVLLRLAARAFRPGRFPSPLMHIDTGFHFAEVITFRDARAAELDEQLVVRFVQDTIDRGRVVEERGPGVSDPHEEPLTPEVVVDSARESVEESAARIMAALEEQGYLPRPPYAR